MFTPFTGGGIESLIDVGSSGGQVTSDYVAVPATSSDPMLDEFLAADNSEPVKKKEEASLDDLDFWLSKDKPATAVSDCTVPPKSNITDACECDVVFRRYCSSYLQEQLSICTAVCSTLCSVVVVKWSLG